MATEEKVAQCVAHYRGLLDSRPQPPESLSQAPDSRLHVIIGRAGAKRRSTALLTRLDQAFKDEGIQTWPPLSDLKSDERVFMFDAKHPIEGLAPSRQLFPNEQALQSFLWANRDALKELRKLGLSGFQEQAVLDSGRRVDLLCERRALNQLVAIELKVAQPDDRATGQIEQYLDELARYSKKHGYDSAHLILVAGQPDKSVRNRVEHYAQTRGLTVTYLLYRVQMELVAHP